MASFDLWRKASTGEKVAVSDEYPPPQRGWLENQILSSNKLQTFQDQHLNLWKNPSAWPHLRSPSFFFTNFVHLYTSFTTKPWKKQENLRLFPRWHACHQCHSKVGSGPTFAAARWILWRPKGRPVASTRWQEIGWFLGFLHLEWEEYLDIWSWGGMIWLEKSRNWKKIRCEIQSFQTIDLFWVLAVPFPNRHDLGCTQPYATEETQQVPWIHWSNPCCRSDRTLSTAYGSRGPSCGFLENGCRVLIVFLPLEEGEITQPMVMLNWV